MLERESPVCAGRTMVSSRRSEQFGFFDFHHNDSRAQVVGLPDLPGDSCPTSCSKPELFAFRMDVHLACTDECAVGKWIFTRCSKIHGTFEGSCSRIPFVQNWYNQAAVPFCNVDPMEWISCLFCLTRNWSMDIICYRPAKVSCNRAELSHGAMVMEFRWTSLKARNSWKKNVKNWNNQSNHGSENGAVVHFSMSRFVNFSASRSKRCPMSVVKLRRVYLKIGYPKIWGLIIICPYVSQQIAVNGGTISRMGLLEFSSGHQALLLHGGLMQVKEHEVTTNRVESQKVLESRPKGGGTKVSWRDVYWENMWRDLLSVIYWPELNYHSMLLTR